MNPIFAILAFLVGFALAMRLYRTYIIYDCPNCETTPDVYGGQDYNACPQCGAEVEESKRTGWEELADYITKIGDTHE